ncbi:hypothetical protein [Microcystis phage Mae-JY22]
MASFVPYVAHRVAAERKREALDRARRVEEARRAEKQRRDPNARKRVVEHLRRMRAALRTSDAEDSADSPEPDEEGA